MNSLFFSKKNIDLSNVSFRFFPLLFIAQMMIGVKDVNNNNNQKLLFIVFLWHSQPNRNQTSIKIEEKTGREEKCIDLEFYNPFFPFNHPSHSCSFRQPFHRQSFITDNIYLKHNSFSIEFIHLKFNNNPWEYIFGGRILQWIN